MLHIFVIIPAGVFFLLLIKQDECRSVRKMERKMNGKQGVKLVYRKEEQQHSISEVTHSHTSLSRSRLVHLSLCVCVWDIYKIHIV